MLELLLILIPIALIDCLSPVWFALLATLLGGRRPVIMGSSYVGGIFVGHTLLGLLVSFGLGKLIEQIGRVIAAEWNKPVETGDLILQAVIGILMVVFSMRVARPKKRAFEKAEKVSRAGVRPLPIFALGVVSAILPSPGTLPYFAALNQVSSQGLSMGQQLSVLLFYNLVFIIPLSSVIAMRCVSESFSQRMFGTVTGFFKSRGRRVITGLLWGLGTILIADAIGFYFGFPILPI